MKRQWITALIAALFAALSPLTGATLAHASTARPAQVMRRRAPARVTAMRWARSRQGAPYQWGGTGPGYDCSGLVKEAYAHAGLWLPHSTYAMLSSGRLRRTWHPQMGDLAFYGRGHVELVTRWYHQTYGAQSSGTRVGWHHWSGWWHPTAYYRVIG